MYDASKNQYYLHKNVLFEPYEIKHFYIKVKNIWIIPEDQLKRYLEEAEILDKQLSTTKFAEDSKALLSAVKRNINTIIETQTKAESIKEYMSTFRGNNRRLDIVGDDINRMRMFAKDFRRKKREENRQALIQRIVWLVVVFIVVILVLTYGVWLMIVAARKRKKT